MKPSLLLLHGAIGAKQQLQPLADCLQYHFTIHLLNFLGHGSNTSEETFSIDKFANQTAIYIQENNLEQVYIFGYSMGGYVALYLAKHQPHLVSCICTLATKFLWDADIAAREIKMLNAAKIEKNLPAFANTLQQRHAPANWKNVLQKTAAMLLEMGNQNPLKPTDYATIQRPVLLLLGEQDKMVTAEETMQVYKELPNAQMCILPNTYHPIEQVDLEQLEFQLMQFFAKKMV